MDLTPHLEALREQMRNGDIPIPIDKEGFRAFEAHYVMVVHLEGEAGLAVERMLFNADIVAYEDRNSISHRWTYPDEVAACAHLTAWIGGADDEPAGWTRHRPSDRRRVDGDPSREEIRP